MKNWTFCLGSAALVLSLSGCFDAKTAGIGRRPLLPYIAPVKFTDEQAVALKAFHDTQPELFTLLQNKENAYRKVFTVYMEDAVKINYGQLVNFVGYTKDEAKEHIQADLKKLGYPETDGLVKGL